MVSWSALMCIAHSLSYFSKHKTHEITPFCLSITRRNVIGLRSIERFLSIVDLFRCLYNIHIMFQSIENAIYYIMLYSMFYFLIFTVAS